MSMEPMWMFHINDISQKSSYVPLLHDLRETSTERFVKPAVVHNS